MKKRGLIILFLFVVFLFSFKNYNDDEIKITGNTLLMKVKLLDGGECLNLEKAKIFLLAYQELHKNHKSILHDNSEALKLIENKLNRNNCRPNALSIPSGYSLTRKVTVGGNGIGNTKGKEIPSYLLATYYMSNNARESFLSNLPSELKNEYFKLKNEFHVNNQKLEKKIIEESNLIKSLDNQNYVNWYFQNNNEIFKKLDIQRTEELKFDLKLKTQQFQN
ncbi:hypothetical protein [Winogradskyella sp. SYSU M77433]|uniref:hypothetical protein n=1 Tax=Winogradskyella sp. SYSU M77433 TaxID=3042722 RepID=UPI002480636F|nr:hypothetical protein [Winogradskyella sp. SYSU M77433]MDH7911336.1 hypothetical protein [Winogradskyella sp. SYSU M77433]